MAITERQASDTTVPRPSDLGPDPEPAREPLDAGTSSTFVVGYDGSAFARRALRWARDNCGPQGRVIVAIGTEAVPERLAERWQEVLHREDRVAASRLLEQLEPSLLPPGLDWRAEIVEGDGAADALVIAAGRHRADAIVVGSHGYGALQALLGSVSHRLLRISPVAVVVLGPETL